MLGAIGSCCDRRVFLDRARVATTMFHDPTLTATTAYHLMGCLDNALKNTITAYIDHSNAWLGGTVDLDPSMIDHGKFSRLANLAHRWWLSCESSRRSRERGSRDPNQPKRPLTAYLFVAGENREKIHLSWVLRREARSHLRVLRDGTPCLRRSGWYVRSRELALAQSLT